MKKLKLILGINQKLEEIKSVLKESLDAELEYSILKLVVKTDKKLIPLAKTIYVTPSDVADKYNVEVFISGDNPNETILSEIYNRTKTKDWEKAKYGHDNPKINLLLDVVELNMIINWKYSKIN